MGDNSLHARMEGHVDSKLVDQESTRLGSSRTPDDIPLQGKATPLGYKHGIANPNDFRPSSFETRAFYRIGPPQRPNIVHDRGFLIFGRRAPSDDDRAALMKWRVMLEGAEALRPDLADALAAYRYFLEGHGRKRVFSYERYASSDASGRVTLRNAILEFQYAAVELALDHPDLVGFQMTGPAIPCGADPTKLPFLSSHFPYPATENWQKAIGSHTIWLSGLVQVVKDAQTGRPSAFKGTMDLHAEDRYNFNPGAQDIATGIPDSENGRFEITGLGSQYENYATLRRVLAWNGLEFGVSSSSSTTGDSRNRQPSDNRRLRDRL